MNSVISTIVVNYNSVSCWVARVDSLLNYPMEIEIIVVANHRRMALWVRRWDYHAYRSLKKVQPTLVSLRLVIVWRAVLLHSSH